MKLKKIKKLKVGDRIRINIGETDAIVIKNDSEIDFNMPIRVFIEDPIMWLAQEQIK